MRLQTVVLAILGTALLAPALNTRKATIRFAPDGSVTAFYADMRMVTAHRLPSDGTGAKRYVSEEFGENSYPKQFACAYVLSTTGDRKPVTASAKPSGVDSSQAAMYSMSAECFRFNGAEVNIHLYDANAQGWQISEGKKITGQFKADDPARDVAAYQYVVPRYKAKAAAFQRAHPGSAPDVIVANIAVHKLTEPGVKPPVLIHSVDAELSEDARVNHIQGVSVIKTDINPDGIPMNVDVVQRAGHGLDESAMRAIEQYRYRPATLNGVPIAVTITVRVNFVRNP